MTTKDEIERLFRTHYAAMYRLAMLILRDEQISITMSDKTIKID